MKYIVCVTNFHLLLAENFSKNWPAEIYRIIDLRRRGDTKDWRAWLKGRCDGLIMLAHCLIDRKSHVVVSHPYNLWFSLFIYAGRKVSLYDDGIAYYNNSRAPSGLVVAFYSTLSKKVSDLLRAGVGYKDILISANIERYYCLYPKLFAECESYFKSKITSIVLPEDEFGSTDGSHESVVVFLDSTPAVLSYYNAVKIFDYFKLKFLGSQLRFYYKPHPSKETLLSAMLAEADWAYCIDGGFECFVMHKNITEMYSFYSSASMVVRAYSKTAKIYCLGNEHTGLLFSGVAPLMKLIGAEVLCVES
ncbi:polysialyltransferase family glycosyltransferase [Pseudomonas ogarae]|uniref:polysialyltransferase family glycosyltransferase n=1 Tax=Pseudomonas ogarae (strain DSM 112162 / CECT 30235 / F113) TaxID=1114970 RepID=UPI0019505FDE|nr:polysialyltransferase family glycosyltransferase [Pseudomonas ogarae]